MRVRRGPAARQPRRVAILQHPQEQDRLLGTARLAAYQLRNATLKIGLSWPSLSKALGREVDPKRWAVLYLGSAKAAELAPRQEVVVLDRKGQAEAQQAAALRDLEGVIVLDGTWSQAKALWWRNAWMLKCRRVIRTGRAIPLRQTAARAAQRRVVDDRSRRAAAVADREASRH